eukprot:TRINITY_DN3376_c0_g3_i1.p2 TRINITY_DN3376_c0_g3~~TRINITY_DN3376_c0_g3_i1.p2  ORF type:complete len:131 (+),score=41.02 TRINITY_DN3376_c0_g3_i1:684-1076(+)
MNYLATDTNMDVLSYIEKKGEKLKDFRKYLVNKDIMLSFTKYLLALRNAEVKPSDPVSYLQDYFGKYRDPAWDEVNQLKADNKQMEETVEILKAKIEELEKTLERERAMLRIHEAFQKFDKDKAVRSALS